MAMSPKDLKTLSDLNHSQLEYIRDNAMEMFVQTMLPPNDFPEDIIASNCACCSGRKRFMEHLLSLG